MTITWWVIDYHATSEEGVHRETVGPGGDSGYLYSDKLNGLSEGSEPCDWHRAEVFIIQISSSSNINVLQIKTIRMEQSSFHFLLKI